MLKWVFGADTGPFRRSLASMRSEVGAFGKSIAGQLAGAFTFGAAVAGFKKVIQSASDLEEAVSKSGTVFGDNADEVSDWASGLAGSMGQAESKALEAAASFGAVFKVLGAGEKEAAAMSMRLVELASDMASFHNSSPEEALTAIAAGLRGESEPLRRFAVLLDDATLKAEAMQQGLYNGTGTLTAQSRSLAAYQVILRQTTAIQGDFAKNADQVANSERIIAAEAENAAAKIGTQVLPQWQRFLDILKSLDVGPIADGFGVVLKIGLNVIHMLNFALAGFAATTIRNWQAVFDAISLGWEGVVKAGEAAKKLDGTGVKEGLKTIKTAFADAFSDIGRNYKEMFTGFADDVESLDWGDPPAAKTGKGLAEEQQRQEMENAMQRMKLEEEIAKLKEEERQRGLSAEQKMLELQSKRAALSADSLFQDGTPRLEAEKQLLEINKQIYDLEKKRAEEREKEAQKTAELSLQLAAAVQAEMDVDRSNRMARMTDEEKIAALRKEQADLMRQAKEAEQAGQYVESVEKRTEAKRRQGEIDSLMETRRGPQIPTVIADDLRRIGGGGRAVAGVMNPNSGVEQRQDRTNILLVELKNEVKQLKGVQSPSAF